MALNSIDIDCRWNARCAQQRQHECIRRVAHQDHIEVVVHRIEHREKSVAHRFEILVADRREYDAINAIVEPTLSRLMRRLESRRYVPAIHRHSMTSPHQPCA